MQEGAINSTVGYFFAIQIAVVFFLLGSRNLSKVLTTHYVDALILISFVLFSHKLEVITIFYYLPCHR